MSDAKRPAAEPCGSGQDTAREWTKEDCALVDEIFNQPLPPNLPPFQPYPDDPVQAGIRRLHELVDLKETAANVICEAGREQIDEWMSWLQSLVTNIAHHQLQDLIPPAAIEQYRDCNGHRLPGVSVTEKHAIGENAWAYIIQHERNARRVTEIEPTTVLLDLIDTGKADAGVFSAERGFRTEHRELYLRTKLIPAVAYVLASAFSDQALSLRDENYALKVKIAELEQRNRKLQERCAKLASNLDASRDGYNGL